MLDRNTYLETASPEILPEPNIDDFGTEALDNIGLLKHDAGRFPLLTAEQEVDLAKQIEQGNHAAEQLSALNGTATEELRQNLLADIEAGKDAKSLFISSNVRLVISIASKVGRHSPVEQEDRVQMGMEGLIRAVELFDYRMGNKFSTYATWWVKQSIGRYSSKESRTVRLPSNVDSTVRQVSQVRTELFNELARDPSDEELSDELGFDVVEFMKKVEPALGRVSLNAVVDESQGTELIDLMTMHDGGAAMAEVDDELTLESLFQAMRSCLDEREVAVMKLRFGMDGQDPMTYSEIGRVFEVTGGRIRDIVKSASDKLAGNRSVRVLAKHTIGSIPPPPKPKRRYNKPA